MSGHSKWSTIKRKKGLKDQQKGQLFSKLSRQITLAVLEGGGMTDPEKNVKLRMAVEKAKSENMPKENITRAIEKGVGPDRQQLQEVVYEGFAPGGVALLIQTSTDNSNRTHSEIRNVLDKLGGKVASQGAVSYLFTKCAMIVFDNASNNEDDIFDFGDQVQVIDVDEDDVHTTVYFPFENLGRTSTHLGNLIPLAPPELDYKPNSTIQITDPSTAKQILNLIEALEGLDDVHKVFANFDIPDNLLS